MNKWLVGGAVMLALVPVAGIAGSFDAAFERVMPLCEEFFLPNSMAREPGYDINARLKVVEAEINRQSRAFAAPGGEAYLKARSRAETDDVALACMRRLQQAIAHDARKSARRRRMR